jgi:hypothetical protein
MDTCTREGCHNHIAEGGVDVIIDGIETTVWSKALCASCISEHAPKECTVCRDCHRVIAPGDNVAKLLSIIGHDELGNERLVCEDHFPGAICGTWQADRTIKPPYETKPEPVVNLTAASDADEWEHDEEQESKVEDWSEKLFWSITMNFSFIISVLTCIGVICIGVGLLITPLDPVWWLSVVVATRLVGVSIIVYGLFLLIKVFYEQYVPHEE